MSTKHTSLIPMSPSLLPKQGLNEVVSLASRPQRLDPKIELDEPLLRQPPKASPRKLTYLFSVEWAWSPMHNRIDNYYLNQRRSDWLLWNNYADDGTVPWSWHWQLLAYGNRCQSDEKTIAVHLILELWKWDAKYNMVGLHPLHRPQPKRCNFAYSLKSVQSRGAVSFIFESENSLTPR